MKKTERQLQAEKKRQNLVGKIYNQRKVVGIYYETRHGRYMVSLFCLLCKTISNKELRRLESNSRCPLCLSK